MFQSICLVHYHEIGLKGKNRSAFENQLIDNLRRSLKDFEIERIGKMSGYIYCEPSQTSPIHEIAHTITRVPGVARVSVALKTPLEESAFCKAAELVMSDLDEFSSFKVHGRKSSTDYALHSIDLNRIVGSHLCAAFPDKLVEMHAPDVVLTVHVIHGFALVYASRSSYKGVGGLPVGTAGKVVTLFSSGFDSPVATWMVGRRGAITIPIHFSGRPMTANTSEYLCQDLCLALAPSASIPRLYVVPFGEHQREISLVVPQSLRIIMYRRMMFSVAERLARIEGAKALVTGESLGQVASQTLDNMAVVNECVSMPVLRPLVGSDKQEILARAQELKTFEISSQTAPDCCTLFMPRSPETHAKLDKVLEAWELFDHETMIEDLIKHIEYIDYDVCPSYHPPKHFRHKHSTLKAAHNFD